MPISIKKQGWPLLVIDTQEEKARLAQARVRARERLPHLFETEIDGKRYRIRGYLNDGLISGSVCEWFYKGEWKRMFNYEIMDQLKELFYESIAVMEGAE